MSGFPITPRTCIEQHFSVSVSCGVCRSSRPVQMNTRAWLLHLDEPLEAMWARLGFRCRKCEALADGLSVSRQVVGHYEQVMHLQRPAGWALEVLRDRIRVAREAEASGAQDARIRTELELVARRIPASAEWALELERVAQRKSAPLAKGA